MDEAARALHSAFVGAFPAYLKAILGERGLPELDDEAVFTARDWLDAQLEDLLALPLIEQARSPLELFQEAMEGLNARLSELGVRPPLRDPVTVSALPGDTYGLAPASSSVLGEAAFEAHLAWGAGKAATVGPVVSDDQGLVVLVSRDLVDRSRFEDAANGAGLQLEVWAARSDLRPFRPAAAFVDLTHPAAGEAVPLLAQQGTRVVAFGPHVDDEAFANAIALGADSTISRSALFKSLGQQLPRRT